MLTVKYVDQQGIESVYAAKGVQYFPLQKQDGNKPQPLEKPTEGVLVHNPDGTITNYPHSFQGSSNDVNPFPKVYVMNEAGKTVATYTL